MLTSQEARAIVAKWRDKFPSAEALMTSYDRYEARIAGPARNATGFERWLAEDADQQHVRAAVMSTLILTAESQPQQGVDLDPPTLAHFVANGDLHDWSELEPVRHAAKCPRCQLGIRSRAVADERAAVLGKKPFPNFGIRLASFREEGRQRCDDCGEWEDATSSDACGRSFWHLPDIYLALHPDHTLEDLGQTGPFMRAFLRRQRQS